MTLVSADPRIYLLDQSYSFPDPREANDPEGLVAVGGDLSPMRLLSAYRRGIFPWFTYRRMPYWFSPNPRLVLEPSRFHLSKSLQRVIQSGKFEIRYDTAFADVITKCAAIKREGQHGTWITKPFIESYTQLHTMGYAHSVETYYYGRLVGGLYGVQVGRLFCGESMFSIMSDASKVALHALVLQSLEWEFELIDCQVPTDHLQRMGAEVMDREHFLQRISQLQERML